MLTFERRQYRRFIAGPTLNNPKKEVEFFWKLLLNVVENVAKVKILLIFLFLAECNFSTLINYSTNMC